MPWAAAAGPLWFSADFLDGSRASGWFSYDAGTTSFHGIGMDYTSDGLLGARHASTSFDGTVYAAAHDVVFARLSDVPLNGTASVLRIILDGGERFHHAAPRISSVYMADGLFRNGIATALYNPVYARSAAFGSVAPEAASPNLASAPVPAAFALYLGGLAAFSWLSAGRRRA